MSVRAARSGDQDAIGRIAEAAGLFPAEYLEAMIAPAFNGADDAWRVCEAADRIVGFAFARPEALTDRTWNLLAIAVDAQVRRDGMASALLETMERDLDARIIIIETTQLPDQEGARAFYRKHGYEEQGHVRDFFGDGEDKVIFRKALA